MRPSKARTGLFVLKMGLALTCLCYGNMAFAASVTLAWNANPEADLAGYKVQYGVAPGVHPTTIDVGKQTNYVVGGLGPGTYYFVVLAYNTSGLQSPSSNEVSATIAGSTPQPPPTTTSLTASPATIARGGNVTTPWSGIGTASVKDWIGQYPSGVGDSGYIAWKYTSSCAQSPGTIAPPSGSCAFAMPTPGTYQFRLFSNDTYTRLASSGAVTVTGTGTLTATPSAVAPGGTVTISWSNVTGATIRDWIGRYEVGGGDVQYADWKYTSSCSQNPGGSALASGSCAFAMPTPGTYQFRLFSNDTYTRLATSGAVTVTGTGALTASPSAVAPGGTVTVSWSNVTGATVRDWIGRYEVGGGDVQYADWKYTSSCSQNPGGSALASGSCAFIMPLTPGTYEFRLFTDNSYSRLAASGLVMVGAP